MSNLIQLDETLFQESLRNPKRAGQIGKDQRMAIMYVWEVILPALNRGETRFFIYHQSIISFFAEHGEIVTRHAVDKMMRRLRKDFLVLVKRQFSGYSRDGRTSSAACYEINPAYLIFKPMKASDVYHLWMRETGSTDRYFTALMGCWSKGKKGTAKNLIEADATFQAIKEANR